MNKFNIIIDADPGVDDAVAMVFAMFNKNLDIKLITSVAGNRSVDVCTRNTLHILDKYNVNIPVARGAANALCRKSKDAKLYY